MVLETSTREPDVNIRQMLVNTACVSSLLSINGIRCKYIYKIYFHSLIHWQIKIDVQIGGVFKFLLLFYARIRS
jgi:hypothetical protein